MAACAIEIIAPYRGAPPARAGDLCNLLQVAASALHLIDRQLDDDLRPLVRIGLCAIRQAAGAMHAELPDVAINATRSIRS